MKAKITRGRGFRGCLDYNLGPDKGAVIVGGNLDGNTSRLLTAQLVAAAATRPDIAKPVWHCSLSLPPGERPTNADWERITDDYMRKMGFNAAVPWVAIRHHDAKHDNVHIVASRVGYDGNVWLGRHEALRAIRATQKIEAQYGLAPCTSRDRKTWLAPHERRAAAKQPDAKPARQRIQDAIDAALASGSTKTPEFVVALERQGISVRPNLASTGRLHGYGFGLDGIVFKGSQLGKAYTYKSLQARGLQYDQDTDQDMLLALVAEVEQSNKEQPVSATSTAVPVVQEDVVEVFLAEPVEPEQVLDEEERESGLPEPKSKPKQIKPRKPETLIERERRLMARVRDEKVEIDANEQTRGQNERVQRDEGRPGGQSAVAEQSAETVGDDAGAAGRDSGADGRRDAGAFEAHEQRSGVPGGAGEKGVLTPSPTKAQVEPEREPEIDAAAPAAQVEVQPDDPVQQAQKRADGALCRQLEAMGRQAWATSWNERNPHYQASPPALRKVIQDLVQHHPTDQSQIIRNMVADRRQVSTLCGVIASYARIAEDMRIASLGDPAAVRDAHRALIEARQQQPKEQREVVRGDGWGRE